MLGKMWQPWVHTNGQVRWEIPVPTHRRPASDCRVAWLLLWEAGVFLLLIKTKEPVNSTLKPSVCPLFQESERPKAWLSSHVSAHGSDALTVPGTQLLSVWLVFESLFMFQHQPPALFNGHFSLGVPSGVVFPGECVYILMNKNKATPRI